MRRAAFALVFCGLALWVVGEFMVQAAESPTQVLAGRRVVFLGISLFPVAWFWAGAIVGRPAWFRRRPWLVVLPAVPLLACYSLLWWGDGRLFVHWTARPPQRGPLFWAQALVIWSLAVAGALLFLRGARRVRDNPLRVAAIAGGALLPLVGNLAYLLGGATPVDPTPVLMGVGAVALRLAVIDSGVASLLPLGQRPVLDQLRTGVVIADLEGHVLDANRAAVGLLGDRPIGKRLADLLDGVRSDPERVLAVEEVPLHGRLGGAIGTAALLTDRTRAARMEEQLRERQRLESLGVLAGGIAHDFNNLLTGVISNTGLARAKLPTEHAVQRPLADAVQSARVASHLTEQLLAYAGKSAFQVRPLDLSFEVRAIGSLLRSSVGTRGPLVLELADELRAAQADPAQIQQVLLNLVLNAAEASAPGSPIHVRTENRDLGEAEVRAVRAADGMRPGRYVLLQVEDHGVGMDAATLARLFEPFFTRKRKGRGLGLAATLGIVQAHGGGVAVESKPGAGSRFDVFLPACDEPAVRDERDADARPTAPSRPTTVLVVDDEEYVLEAAYFALEHYGYAVFTASDGREAAEVFRAHADAVDVVLLDVTMPGMSAADTLRALRAVRPNVRVVLTSGYDEQEASRSVTADGLAGFLRKPYDPDQLAAKIQQVLGDAGA